MEMAILFRGNNALYMPWNLTTVKLLFKVSLGSRGFEHKFEEKLK
jgi:hypothetical protein